MLTAGALRGLLDDFSTAAFRMETLATYALDYEASTVERYLAGTLAVTPDEIDWYQPWLDRVQRVTRSGRRIERVRVLDEPLTPYQRFNLWAGQWNERAGERIQYLPRRDAQQLGIPTGQDWWLFDSSVLVLMLFDDAGRLTGRELVDDGRMDVYVAWRDLARQHGHGGQAAA